MPRGRGRRRCCTSTPPTSATTRRTASCTTTWPSSTASTDHDRGASRMYDLKITGGTIVDGTGSAGYTGDVAIKDGTVVAMGAAVDDTTDARTTIDAAGKVVSPGFV